MTDVLFKTKGKRSGLSIADRIDATGDCWEWTGYRNPSGYGCVGVGYIVVLVHRLVWETLVGPIPEDKNLDHLCRNPPCCNPDHLEPVTHTVNVQRGVSHNRNKTRCTKYGHPLSGDNLYVNTVTGSRQCRACQKENIDNWFAARRNA